MSEKLDEMETRLNEQVQKNIELHEAVGAYRKNEILTELTRGLAETQKDKFTSQEPRWNSRLKSRIVAGSD